MMKFLFSDKDINSNIPLKIEEIKLSPNEYATYALEYAFNQIKNIQNPKEAAEKFKEIANEFLENLPD